MKARFLVLTAAAFGVGAGTQAVMARSDSRRPCRRVAAVLATGPTTRVVAGPGHASAA